jgi:dimethylamine/trimethylamine dehydrogenase
MECAVVLAKRGFVAVHLVEAADAVGGRLRWARELPTLGDWGRLIDYRSVQLQKLPDVEVITSRTLSASDVLEYGAELVVLATGSHWRGDGVQPGERHPIEGADAQLPHVLTPEQVMVEGKRPSGRRVVVYDTDGYYVGPGVAEQLAGEGFDVHLVTTFPVVSPISDGTLEGPMLRQHLHSVGVAVTRDVTVTSVDPDRVRGRDEFGQDWSMPADALVLVTQQESNDGLYQDLGADQAALAAAGITGLFRIGDANAPRMISEAIFDGHRLAREIDCPDPATPLPYLRERTI